MHNNKDKSEESYPLSLQAVLMLQRTCGAGLGQPVLHTGTLREAGVRLTVLLFLQRPLQNRSQTQSILFE